MGVLWWQRRPGRRQRVALRSARRRRPQVARKGREAASRPPRAARLLAHVRAVVARAVGISIPPPPQKPPGTGQRCLPPRPPPPGGSPGPGPHARAWMPARSALPPSTTDSMKTGPSSFCENTTPTGLGSVTSKRRPGSGGAAAAAAPSPVAAAARAMGPARRVAAGTAARRQDGRAVRRVLQKSMPATVWGAARDL
jgi:hypothetical protein